MIVIIEFGDLSNMDAKVTTPIANRNRLHFQHASVNLGGGYNATSGCFEAPTTGTYFFTVTLYVS